ncbi:hypothetical protein B0E44_11710 [Flavobacterium sp. A45]|nr:hypothetical protein B0E44_11710 [Flavobacterium sp. A45]
MKNGKKVSRLFPRMSLEFNVIFTILLLQDRGLSRVGEEKEIGNRKDAGRLFFLNSALLVRKKTIK